jgi:kinesin family protein 5
MTSTRRQSLKLENDESKGNVSVVCRFRPINSKELELSTETCVSFNSDCKSVKILSEGTELQDFTFDYVFDTESTQKQVYETAAMPIIQSVLDGFNGTVLAYGQTSSGKTFTMTGYDIEDPSLKGVVPRMIDTVFSHIENSQEHIEFAVKVSYCEIYMEKIKDLLAPHKNNLQVHEDKARGIFIQDITEEYVSSEFEVMELMKIGTQNREVGFTCMNEGSSRSHSIFLITLQQTNTIDFSCKVGKLFLVDLAGSEKVSKTKAGGKRLDEAKNINKSLSTLGMVINSLTDGKSTHVPYRDSKLTRVLQDSLGGNSKTTLIITCSPSVYNLQETLGTLRFGIRAKAVKNKAHVNREYTVSELKLLLAKAEEEIMKKDSRITKLEERLKEVGIHDITVDYGESALSDIDLQKIECYTEEIEQLNNKIEYLNTRNENLNKENNSLNSRLMNIILSLQSLEDSLNDSQDNVQKLTSKNASLQKELDEMMRNQTLLSKTLSEKDEEIARLTERIDTESIAWYQEKNDILKELDEFRAKVPQVLSEEAKNLDNIEINLDQEILRLNNIILEQRNLIEKYESRLKETQENLLKVKENKMESDKQLKIKVNSLERGLEQINLVASSLRQQKSNLIADSQSYEKKVQRYQRKIIKLEKQNNQYKESLLKYKQRTQYLRKEFAASEGIPVNLFVNPHPRIRKYMKGGHVSKLSHSPHK